MNKPTTFVIDVDGVMTDGGFYYSPEGKLLKRFGPDDHDALGLLKPHMDIQFVTGDSKGFDISRKRIVDDMHFPLELVSTVKRVGWIRDKFDLASVVYMGDGIFDHYVLREVGYGIAPADGDPNALSAADYVTKRSGGDRAVAEACLHLLAKFFEAYDPAQSLDPASKFSGSWGT
jgi:3-deoxy-D-manno-octulosonate 8-phosphate phosphatase (KDO 8-P phosphatase)